MNKDSNYTRVCVWGQCGKHCSKDGKTDCTQAQTYGQLQELVEEGFECPLGHFGKELVELHPLHANWRYDQLVEKGIVIRNRTTQPLFENCFRISDHGCFLSVQCKK